MKGTKATTTTKEANHAMANGKTEPVIASESIFFTEAPRVRHAAWGHCHHFLLLCAHHPAVI